MEPSLAQAEVLMTEGGGYPILIGWGCLRSLGVLLQRHAVLGEAFVLSDRTVWRLYGKDLEEGLSTSDYRILDRFLIDPGEESKNLRSWEAAINRLVEWEDGTVRRIFVLNLGGGVVGDLGGFVAASYRRGIPYVQIPTTLLAQVDSSVGGKTGVNHPGGKNLVGAFYQPRLVVADLETLRSLDKREIRSGLVEVMKYGLIRDACLFEDLEGKLSLILDLEERVLRRIVQRSCEIKSEIVCQDEKEQAGVRTLLNLGHTFGHALEAATDYKRYTHGEAVAIGILCAAWISVALEMLPVRAYERIESLVERMGLERRIRDVEPDRFWEVLKRDKKFIHRRNRFVLLEEIGRARVVEGVDRSVLSQALEAHMEGAASPRGG